MRAIRSYRPLGQRVCGVEGLSVEMQASHIRQNARARWRRREGAACGTQCRVFALEFLDLCESKQRVCIAARAPEHQFERRARLGCVVLLEKQESDATLRIEIAGVGGDGAIEGG